MTFLRKRIFPKKVSHRHAGKLLRTLPVFCANSFLIMRYLCQVVAWVLVFDIVVLSIVPPDYRVITDLPRSLEHLSIFLLTGVAFGLGYPERYPLQSIALVLFAAAVELVQVWVPGRHARLSDFAAGVVGLGLGTGLAYLSTRMARRKKNGTPLLE